MAVRVLWVATKSPLPATDGGRRVTAETLAALSDAGVGGVIVAPGATDAPHAFGRWRVVGVPATSRLAALRHLWSASCPSAARHVNPVARAAVAHVLARERIDVVHAEQVYALPQCEPARALGIPIVLRAQNVEHEVLGARAAGWPMRLLRRFDAARMLGFEADGVRLATATVALTARDADALTALAGPGGRIAHVSAPFPDELPAGSPLDGAPAVVLFGSGGWFPNRDGAGWFVARAWPAIRARLPRARLHVIGLGSDGGAVDGVTMHAAPADSRTAFPREAVFVVPSRIATGVRMKILEAWARGLPVVATPEAASGLERDDEPAWLEAGDADDFAGAIASLHDDPARAARLCDAGRRILRRHHDPARIATRLRALYATAAGGVIPAAPDRRPPATAAPPTVPL